MYQTMKSFLKSCFLKIPIVRRYVSRVRERHDEAEREIKRLRDAVRNGDRVVHEYEQLRIHSEAIICERDALTADLRAAISACANISSMHTAVRDKLAVLVGERDGLAGDLAAAQEKLTVLDSERDRLIKGQTELDTHRRALLAQTETLTVERSSLIDQLEKKDRHVEWITANQQTLLARIGALEATERWLRHELVLLSNRIEAHVVESSTVPDLSSPLQSAGRIAQSERIVEFAFQVLLDRQPRADEKDRFCKELDAGISYETLASEILLSPDGRANRRNRERFAQIYERNLQFPSYIMPERGVFPIDVVDVGAQLLDMMDHVYAPMMRERLCRVIGFEPLGKEAARRAAHEPSTKILPYFIGDGEDATFHINAFNPTSSVYPSNPDMKKFKGLAIVLPTLSTEPASTRRLDDLPEVERCDYLKIDVQGAELKVLSGAPRLLENVSAVHLEVEFGEVYLGQPLFSDIDLYLRSAGFELIDLFEPGYDTYQEAPLGCSGSRLLWSDALYMKRDDLMSDAMLLKAAYIAHANYRKYDLAAHLLALYDGRLKTDLGRQYESYFARDQTGDATAPANAATENMRAAAMDERPLQTREPERRRKISTGKPSVASK
jgi:FkbM family methyltransferase